MPPSRSYRNRCWPQSRSPDEIRGSGTVKAPDGIRAKVLIAGRGSGFSRDCHQTANRFAAKAECRPAVPTDSVAGRHRVVRMKSGDQAPQKVPDCIRATNPDFWNYALAESKNLDQIQKTGQMPISGLTVLHSAKTPVNPWPKGLSPHRPKSHPTLARLWLYIRQRRAAVSAPSR